MVRRRPRDSVNARPVSGPLAVLAALAAVVALFGFAITGAGDTALRCEGAGGHFMVGPAGETVCINEMLFVPVEGFDAAEDAR